MGAPPSKGVVVLNLDGSLVYTPNLGAQGTDTFTYQAYDGVAYSTPATVTIDINGVPVANPDTFATDEDTPLSVPAPGVLGNDIDPEDVTPPLWDTLTASPTTGAANGAVTLNADGSFSYQPNANYFSPPGVPDTFTYRACDAWNACGTGTVSITVTPVNDRPVAAADSARTAQDTAVVISVLANDTDVEGGPLRVAAIVTWPTHYEDLVNGGSDITYTPAAGYVGTDLFEYQVCDPGANGIPEVPPTGDDLCDTATVTVVVNGPPVAQDDAYSVTEDTPKVVGAPGVLADNGSGPDSDPNGDPLRTYLVTGPTHAAAFTLNTDGSFTYLPASNYPYAAPQGPDQFTYQACDPGANGIPEVPPTGDDLCDAATVTLTVTNVNDPPVANNDGLYNTDEDTPLAVAAPGLLLNDNDPVEGSPVTAQAASGISSQGGSFSVAVDGSFSYTPAANFFGTDTFTYRFFDGADYSAPATVTILVASVNDPPVAVDDSAATNQVTPVLINVVGNDYDIDIGGSVVASTAVALSGPSSGSLVNNGNGTFTYNAGGRPVLERHLHLHGRRRLGRDLQCRHRHHQHPAACASGSQGGQPRYRQHRRHG